jgi:hypothetical protein
LQNAERFAYVKMQASMGFCGGSKASKAQLCAVKWHGCHFSKNPGL